MNKTSLALLGLLMTCTVVLAEEHAETALDHAKMAIVQGKAGHSLDLTAHANEALIHAKKASELAKGEASQHLKAAIMSLESAIEHGKMGAGHEDAATKAAEEAVGHLYVGNK